MSAARLLPFRRIALGAAAGVAGIYAGSKAFPRIPTSFDSPATVLPTQSASLVSEARREQQEILRRQQDVKYTKRGDAKIIDDATDVDVYSPGFEDDDDNSWALFSRNVNTVREGISRIQWSIIGDKIADFWVPPWARLIPEGIQKLQFELSMEPGSLADDIWQEAHDPLINPEIMWDARVRVGNGLSKEELHFRHKRKEYVAKALAKYLDIPERLIHPDDVPTIAMCGSGGGLRALVAGTSSYMSAQEAGLFDCVTYTAGVSGSCWLQTLFYSSVGARNHKALLKHIKSRIGTHIAFPPTALKLITSAPTNKFILSGFVEKIKGDPNATFGLVDIYSLLLAARLMVPHGDLDVQPDDLKLSNQRKYIDDGQFPMPIYTAVRHEIPIDEKDKEGSKSNPEIEEKIREKAKKEARFQWFEMHPWEFGSEEFGAWIPTWSLGRPFNDGRNQILDTGIALPEIRQSLLLGIWGSAFTATLAHYYKEIRPLLSGIGAFAGLNELLEEKNDDLVKIHPIEPAAIPNFVYGMRDKLPPTCPESVYEKDHIHLMDAGMSNNLPIYPLLRQGRDVEVIIAFDASADIQKENWLSVVDGYAKQRGIKSWPIGAGWPKESSKPEENIEALTEAQVTSPKEASTELAKAKEKRGAEDNSSSTQDQPTEKVKESPTTGENRPNAISELGPCNIWVGSKQERSIEDEPPPSSRIAWDSPDDSTFALMKPDAGIVVVYFPLLPNPKVPGVDPDKTEFLSTWNFIYTPEQVDKVVELAKTNFEEGNEAVKRTIRAVYERKRKQRLEQERLRLMRRGLRDLGDLF